MSELRSEWFSVNGLRVHARTVVGPKDHGREAVVLVHGLVVSSRYLGELVERLGPWFPTWAPDLPGYGRSEHPDRLLSLAELADALVAWMDAAGLHAAALVGQSFGCQLVVEAAVRHPARVSRLVLQGPTAEPGSRTVLRQLGRFMMNALRDDAGMGPIMVRDYWNAGWERFVHTFRISREDTIEGKLPRIGVPALVLSGEKDPIAPPSWGERVAAALPQGRHAVIAGSAHTAVFMAPQQTARAIQAFLRDEALPGRVPDPRDRSPRAVASFDSSSAMLRACARAAHRDDFPGLGIDSPLEPLVPLGNLVPGRLRETLYSVAGWLEAIPARTTGDVRLSEIDHWMTGAYPRRRYPAVFLGSSNGAALHLAAAMGVPWLPQSFLIPVRRFGEDVNDVRGAMEWGRDPGAALLEANPDLTLHHMHDPNQDYLMSQHMAYFRVKRLRLGPLWERFLRDTLAPGGTLYLVECGQRWPCTRVDERHWFQAGGVGGLEPWEYLRGSARVEEFLRRRGARVRRWTSPEPDAEVAEAEWGFAPALGLDADRFADRHGYRVQRIRFDGPEDLSAPVAELYRAWYREQGMPADRLLVESFVLTEPWWTLRAGAVPYWCSFGVEPAARALARYLDDAEPYQHIHAMLFSHGVDSAGLASAARWRQIIARARADAGFVGTDPEEYPRDFASLRRYHTEFGRRIPDRYVMPAPLPVERVDAWLARDRT